MNRNDQNARTGTSAKSGLSNIGSDKAANSASSRTPTSSRERPQGSSVDGAPQKDTLHVDSRPDGSSQR